VDVFGISLDRRRAWLHRLDIRRKISLRDVIYEFSKHLNKGSEYVWQRAQPTAWQPDLLTSKTSFEEAKDSIGMIGVIMGANDDVRAGRFRDRPKH